jgi:hypothetical protein
MRGYDHFYAQPITQQLTSVRKILRRFMGIYSVLVVARQPLQYA